MLATGEGCLLTCTYHDSTQYVNTFHTTWLSTPTIDFTGASEDDKASNLKSEIKSAEALSGSNDAAGISAALELAKLPSRNEKSASEHENVSKSTGKPECWAHCGAASTPGTKIPIPAVTHESNGPKNSPGQGGRPMRAIGSTKPTSRPQPDTTKTDPRIERRPRRAHATPGPSLRRPSRPSAPDTHFDGFYCPTPRDRFWDHSPPDCCRDGLEVPGMPLVHAPTDADAWSRFWARKEGFLPAECTTRVAVHFTSAYLPWQQALEAGKRKRLETEAKLLNQKGDELAELDEASAAAMVPTHSTATITR